MTLKMFINSADRYKREKTESTTTYVQPTEISLPVSTACIDLKFKKTFDLDIQKEVKSYFKLVNGSKKAVLDRKIPWPHPFLHVVHSYLVYLTDNEASEATDLSGICLKLLK